MHEYVIHFSYLLFIYICSKFKRYFYIDTMINVGASIYFVYQCLLIERITLQLWLGKIFLILTIFPEYMRIIVGISMCSPTCTCNDQSDSSHIPIKYSMSCSLAQKQVSMERSMDSIAPPCFYAVDMQYLQILSRFT